MSFASTVHTFTRLIAWGRSNRATGGPHGVHRDSRYRCSAPASSPADRGTASLRWSVCGASVSWVLLAERRPVLFQPATGLSPKPNIRLLCLRSFSSLFWRAFPLRLSWHLQFCCGDHGRVKRAQLRQACRRGRLRLC